MASPMVDWEQVLIAVREECPELYRAWFGRLRMEQPDRGQVEIRAPGAAEVHYLETNCREAFSRALIQSTGHLVTVRFTCADGSGPPHARGPTAVMPPLLTQTPLAPDYTFEQFVVGPSNRLAHAACTAVSERPGRLYNPLFIHGASGLGKTHLLQATCAAVRKANAATGSSTGARVLYATCETFVNDFVQAIADGTLHAFRECARDAELFVIDDVQFLANRESSQEELFHTFNALHQAGRQVLLSADSPPGEIPTLEDRLVSRFNWGLVVQIDPPSRETRQAILHKKARLRGVDIPDEIIDMIAERAQANVRVLEGTLTRLITETQLGGKPLNVDTAREVLSAYGEAETPPIRISDILEAVSSHYGIRLPDLLGRKRTRSISHPRQVAMYLARRLTPLSLEEIGMHVGGRDHSTVLHAERTIETERSRDAGLAHKLASLTNRLLSRS